MTVVLAVRCQDGLVIASDSQITEKDRDMTYPAQKLHPLGDHAAWGGSGARGVLGELAETLSARSDEIIHAGDVGKEIQGCALPIFRHHYDNFIEDVPGIDDAGTPSAYVLAVGYTGDTPWIVEINPTGLIGRYEDVGFHAIGSGAPMAQQAGALLAHFRMVERPVDYGVLGIVRVLDALAVTSPSVGGPIDVARITPEGAHHLDEKEIEKVRKQVATWEQREHEVLDTLFD
ncbi:MAG: proteasome protein [Actinobacteria bacterium]|jgi:20S proteasome alpha/beta subunit|nr:proteasome protein [Actinomycetota bacterium]